TPEDPRGAALDGAATRGRRMGQAAESTAPDGLARPSKDRAPESTAARHAEIRRGSVNRILTLLRSALGLLVRAIVGICAGGLGAARCRDSEGRMDHRTVASWRRTVNERLTGPAALD